VLIGVAAVVIIGAIGYLAYQAYERYQQQQELAASLNAQSITTTSGTTADIDPGTSTDQALNKVKNAAKAAVAAKVARQLQDQVNFGGGYLRMENVNNTSNFTPNKNGPSLSTYPCSQH
jgi:predicted negative regulator of RcsB-dependent stress response